jgi:hypothetical protein
MKISIWPMRLRHSRLPQLLLLLALGASAAAATACSPVRLVSEYDEQVDRTATRLQRTMDAFLTRLENLPSNDSDRSYAGNKEFYLQYGVDLRALKVRATGLQRNSITVEQVERMENSLEQLRSTHESQNRLSPAAIREFRNLFNVSWTAILTFELAKKRQ